MEIDKEKVDEITLALLYLTTFKDKHESEPKVGKRKPSTRAKRRSS